MQRSRSHRFTKNNRLLDASSFSQVFAKAHRSRDKWFTVLCRNNEMTSARLGLAISKRNCKKAVGRNRIKRIIRESFRQEQHELEGLDIVVMNQAAASDAGSQELFASLTQHWRRCAKTRVNRP
ncbi:MAG TPA: ribonuclease P protein component [Woeseiaceae bacterium]|nr:ribonuclease P protein component [Woeseiaceae bacterium]